jgi:FkbM family methyltransferase
MDRALERYLPEREGFFVEAGANDGYVQSNTYYFERLRGWRGVLVEPIPELFAVCRVERPAATVFNCALVAEDRPGATIKMHYGDLQSVVEGARGSAEDDLAHARAGRVALEVGWDRGWEVEVPARTLSSILDEVGAPEVDLLSLDVEGFEADVLEGLDLERHPPRYVLVEVLEGEASRRRVEEVLGDRYTAVEELSPLDMLYARR